MKVYFHWKFTKSVLICQSFDIIESNTEVFFIFFAIEPKQCQIEMNRKTIQKMFVSKEGFVKKFPIFYRFKKIFAIFVMSRSFVYLFIVLWRSI